MINPHIDSEGNKRWYNEKGEYHRDDGPAYEAANGTKIWYQNDKCHRLDGPAIEYESGNKYWYVEGKLHRNDGPAIERANGTKIWYKNNKRHRLDGPACEYVDRYKEWWVNGELHRLDGPAIERSDGYKVWYQNGLRHRLDGPAIEYADGDKSWWIEDDEYTEEEFNKKIGNKVKKEETTMKEVIKDRFEQAAYRSASRQIVKGISKAIVKAAEQKGMDSFTAAAVGTFFETELGSALIGAILGVGIPYIPKINQDKRALKLAEEFQVESISTVADTVLNEVMTYVVPVVSDALKSLPARIEGKSEDEDVTTSEQNVSKITM